MIILLKVWSESSKIMILLKKSGTLLGYPYFHAILAACANQNGTVNQSDLTPILNARNTPADGPNDPRDLNQDG